jgi:benzoyl-CoA reductase/2-hydroxyglutaryl-CoA dehydratase subunit BcrC/BadD/HgdB
MNLANSRAIGFTCAYTPIPLIEAAGFRPFRILPMGDSEDRAGQWLHDNICPHVKRVLDRSLDGDLPSDMAGVIIMNSCDAMRRLADAWRRVKPDDPVICVDLPIQCDERSVSFFATQIKEVASWLGELTGSPLADSDILAATQRFNELSDHFSRLQKCMASGGLEGGANRLQSLYNKAATREVAASIDELAQIECGESSRQGGVPVFVFGNVMPDPEAISLFESCGARIVDEDMCTGSRLFKPVRLEESDDVFTALAKSYLSGDGCARTIDASDPGKAPRDLLERARLAGARGIIGHTVKFCDPYISRMPAIRGFMRAANMPFLLLEGDCTLRSIGQHRTRIEAFIEMIG